MINVTGLDHMIMCVTDTSLWVDRMSRALLLEPFRMLHEDPWGFSNAEFAIGSGFLAFVAPAGADSPLREFLNRFSDGPYAVSLSVDDLGAAMEELESRGIASHSSSRRDMFNFGWIHPTQPGEPLLQLTEPILRGRGRNVNLAGINRATLLVADISVAIRFLTETVGAHSTESFHDELYGCEAVDVVLSGPQRDTVRILQTGSLREEVRDNHPPILGFTITTHNLRSEVTRLERAGIGVLGAGKSSQRILINPDEMDGMYVELQQLR